MGFRATLRGFHGGDLKGITEDWITWRTWESTAMYLNPIFLAPSNHRYNTFDYYPIDPRLGSWLIFTA